MENGTFDKIFDGSASYGEIVEFLQQAINEGKLWMLPSHLIDTVYQLDDEDIISLCADIEPKEARRRAENPKEIESVEEKEMAEFGGFKVSFNYGGKVSPPRSMRRVFGVR